MSHGHHLSNPGNRDEDLRSQQSSFMPPQPVSNPNPWDENWTAQEEGQRQVVINPDLLGKKLDLPEDDDEEPIEEKVTTVPPVDIMDIPNEVMEGIFEKLSDAEAVRLLSVSRAAPLRWEGKKRMDEIQAKRRLLAKALAAWRHWFRYVRPRDFPRTLSYANRDFRVQEAVKDYYRFNVGIKTGKDTINSIAHRWGVFGTEIRDVITWSETDSSDDDVMQQ